MQIYQPDPGISPICDQFLISLRTGLPSDPGDQTAYLHSRYLQATTSPCFSVIAREISRILITRGSPDDFFRFCMNTGDPEPVINAVMQDFSAYADDRDYLRATEIISYILPFARQSWPHDTTGERRSFRDLLEYTYYITVCQPEHEVTIMPYLQTDILFQYGRMLNWEKGYNQSLPIFILAKEQSPVHAGILTGLAETLLMTGRSEEAVRIMNLSFRTSWKREELSHAYRNQGFYFSRHDDPDAAITCYLMAKTWDDSPEGDPELHYLMDNPERMGDTGFYMDHGKEILTDRHIPVGPDPEIIRLLVEIADTYEEEHDLLQARNYLIRAQLLIMNDELENRICRIECYLEDTGLY